MSVTIPEHVTLRTQEHQLDLVFQVMLVTILEHVDQHLVRTTQEQPNRVLWEITHEPETQHTQEQGQVTLLVTTHVRLLEPDHRHTIEPEQVVMRETLLVNIPEHVYRLIPEILLIHSLDLSRVTIHVHS